MADGHGPQGTQPIPGSRQRGTRRGFARLVRGHRASRLLCARPCKDYLSFKLRAVEAAAGVSALRTQYGNPLLVLLATSALVLLIVCTNLANLIVARASAREREFSVRLTIGASWSRLVRQLMVENGLLAIAGAVAGLVCAGVLSRFLVGFLGSGLSLRLPFDARLIAFVVAMAVATCLTFGLIPAWRASRAAARDAMKASVRSVTGSREGVALRRALVISQVALSLVLLFGALLFRGTLRNLLAVDTGFEPDTVGHRTRRFLPPAAFARDSSGVRA